MNGMNQAFADDERLAGQEPAAGTVATVARPELDPAVEEAHWRENHSSAPYHAPQHDFEAWRPAYELGWRRRLQSEQPFDEHDSDLSREWEARRGASPLDWPTARAASRAAWDRVDRIHYEQAREVGMAEAFAFIEGSDGSLGLPPSPRVGAHVPAPSVQGGVDERSTTADLLNRLLENAHDGEHGYRECAQLVAEPPLKEYFDECANRYRDLAAALHGLVLRWGGTPAQAGTLRAAAQRGWAHLKTALGADGTSALLEQCERAEELSIDRYRSALQHNDLPDALREQLDAQSAAVRRQHAGILELREAAGDEAA